MTNRQFCSILKNMSLQVKQRAWLQWSAAFLILSIAFFGPHMRMPVVKTIVYKSEVRNPSINHLFVDNTGATQLSYLVRDELLVRYGELYRHNRVFYQQMQAHTSAHYENFTDFLVTEKGLLVNLGRSTVAPGIDGPVSVELPIQDLLAFVKPKVVADHFPEFGVQYQKARDTFSQQQYAQQLINEDRSNVNCALMKCIALTFDDGPDGQNGRRIIQALKERKAVGTFFYMGSKVVTQPDEVREASAAGNEIGNHSWSHPRLSQLKDGDAHRELKRTDDVIQEVTGLQPHFMRPPYGDYNLRTISLTAEAIALWNVDSKDWGDYSPEGIIDRTLGKAQPGSVVLFHSIYSRTAEAVPTIIDRLQSQGYVLVTMSELFNVNDENIASLKGQRFFWR